MANQKQEVELLIKAGTEGLKSIGQLVKELEALGEDTGEASEKMEGLAGSLKELRDQQKLIKQFRDLKSQTGQLAEEQQNAQKRSTELGKALSQTEKPTRAQRTEFEKARAATIAAGKAYEDNQRELNGLRDSLGEAGISTRDLSSEQQRIKREIAGVDDEIGNVTSELTQMRDGAQAAAGSSRQLGDDVEKSGTRVGRFRERLQGLSPVLGKVGAGLKTAGVAVAGFVAAAGASIATMTVFSKGQAQVADELTNTGNALDVNREQLQLWRIAGDRVGLSGEKVSEILRRVTERLGEFSATGTGEAGNVLERLNLNIEDLIQLKPDQQMLALANAIGEIGSKSEQVALLEKLASDASQLQPLLENNAAGLEAIFEEAQKDGAIYSDAELDKLNKANDVYNSIDLKLKGLTTRIGAQLAPAVGDATDRVLDLFNSSGAGDKLVEVFNRITRSATDFFETLITNQESIGSSFQTLTDTVQFLGNGMTAVFRTVQTAAGVAVTFVAATLANFLTLASKVTEGLAAIGVVSEESYTKLKAKADAANQTVNALVEQTAEYGRQATKAAKDAGNAFDNADDKISQTTYTLQDVGEAAEDAGDAVERSSDKVRDLKDAYEELGITSQAELTKAADKAEEAFNRISESGDATQKEILEAFKVYAEAVVESGDQARIRALSTVATTMELREALRDVKGEAEGLGERLGGEFDEVGRSAADAKNEVSDLKDEAKGAGEEASRDMSAMGDWFAAIWTHARTAVTKLSDAARNLFERRVGSNQFVEEAENTVEAMDRIEQRLGEIRMSLTRNPVGDFLTEWALETEKASLEVQKAFYAQAGAIEHMQNKVESGAMSMAELNRLSTTAANRFDLLDDQRLSNLQGAIDAARNKMDSLNDSAESTLNSLRQRLADIRGDTEEAQRLQYEAERKRLEEQLKAAREAGASDAVAEYEEALRVLKEINKTEQQNRREQDNQREKEAADRQRDQQSAERERQQYQREVSQPRTPATKSEPAPTQRIDLNLPTGGVASLSGDPESVNDFLEFLNQAGMRASE